MSHEKSSTKISSNLSTIYDAHNTASFPYILRHGSVYKTRGDSVFEVIVTDLPL